jgi:AcrR family transcriptional regulator
VQVDKDVDDGSLPDSDLGLREQKRLETNRRIEDAATRLVDESSFDEVTIEQICEAAGISRRTFFNYFSAKESAVIGSSSEPLTAEQREAFLNAEGSNILHILVENIERHFNTESQDPVIQERRQRIFAQPDVAVRALAFRKERSRETMELLTERLTANPEEQLSPELAPQTEAMLLSGFIREATWLAMSRPDRDCDLPMIDRIYRSMELIKEYTKGLEW